MTFHVGFFVIGLLFFAGGILILLNEIKKRRNNTETVNAEVVAYFTEVHHNADADVGGDSVTHHPIMKYCIDGKWFEQRSETCWNKQKYEIGTKLDILYNPNNPEQFSFPGENTAFIASFIGILIGVVLITFAFIL